MNSTKKYEETLNSNKNELNNKINGFFEQMLNKPFMNLKLKLIKYKT